jgi:hypothetical protein
LASCSNLSLDLAVSIKFAPLLAKSLAIARPMPEEAPVTNIVLLLNLDIFSPEILFNLFDV